MTYSSSNTPLAGTKSQRVMPRRLPRSAYLCAYPLKPTLHLFFATPRVASWASRHSSGGRQADYRHLQSKPGSNREDSHLYGTKDHRIPPGRRGPLGGGARVWSHTTCAPQSSMDQPAMDDHAGRSCGGNGSMSRLQGVCPHNWMSRHCRLSLRKAGCRLPRCCFVL